MSNRPVARTGLFLSLNERGYVFIVCQNFQIDTRYNIPLRLIKFKLFDDAVFDLKVYLDMTCMSMRMVRWSSTTLF